MQLPRNLFFLTVALLLVIAEAGCGGSPQPVVSQPVVSQLNISAGASLPTAKVNTAYSATLSAMGGTAPYSWTLAAGSLPAGLILSSIGTISGTPATNGASTFTVQVSDAAKTPQTATAQMSITVLSPLSITTASLPNGIMNEAYFAALLVTGGKSPYAWTISSGELPPGLSLSAAGGITGTPTAAGASAVTLQVADAESPAGKTTVQLEITIASPLQITTSTLGGGKVNSPYSAQLAVMGGINPYSWSMVSGELPTGLVLAADGSITGTPTNHGIFTFTVQATDGEPVPQIATAQLSITVTSLTITTTSLAVGTPSVLYVDSLTAVRGILPLTWSIQSGELPPGLSLSSVGVISGTPTASGTSSFTVQVADAESPPQVVNAELSIAINSSMQVTTQHYDIFSTGQDPAETLLTPANVNSTQFGKLFSYSVDGFVYAQPLYLANVNIPGKGSHNVVYVATEHDSVYALDADSNSGENSNPLWQVSFIDPAHGITPLSSEDVNCDDLVPEIGITSTPVIDTATGTIYILVRTKENGTFVQRLHALDVATGAEKLGGPTVIAAAYPGNGAGSSGGMIYFDSLENNNRAGLILSNNNIYITWASHCDLGAYHGWVLAYDRTTLQSNGVWAVTPNGQQGGIWMSGAGVSADVAGTLFLATGNGTFDTSGTLTDFGDSIVKLLQNGAQLSVGDYFTPFDEDWLYQLDGDVGAGGVLVLPDQPGDHVHELVQSGKEGTIYVVDRDQMGHYNPVDNSQIVQNIPHQIVSELSVPAYWNNNVYFGGASDHLKAFSLTNGLLSATPTSQSPTGLGFPGATPIVSSNGGVDGIVWALQTSARLNNGNEVLHAYDATDLSNELYNSAQNDTRDDPGPVVKFAVPIVANGKVYTGAVQQVSVYGIISQH
ncbi:MAG: Ig domain-containing protein [Candidatus Korobacteraceae bacterium]